MVRESVDGGEHCLNCHVCEFVYVYVFVDDTGLKNLEENCRSNKRIRWVCVCVCVCVCVYLLKKLCVCVCVVFEYLVCLYALFFFFFVYD